MPDIEGGGLEDDDEDWDDFDSHADAHRSTNVGLSAGGGGAGACAQPEEPEPEPEPDPFAELGMAPTIGKTKRYNARDANVFGKPSQPSSSMFAMSAMDAGADNAESGWGDSDLGDDLGVTERRRLAEERREARRREREGTASPGKREQKRSALRVAATKVSE